MSWPLVAVHAALLDTGQVLMWDAWERSGAPSARLWDPATGTAHDLPWGSMVEVVARQVEHKRETTERAFEGIRVLVENARHAITAGDLAALGKLLDLNQMLLAGLFVSSEDIERMCGSARDHGALGAKLTGAGGGGSVVALAPTADTASRIVSAWRNDGFSGFVTTVGQEPSAYTYGESSP